MSPKTMDTQRPSNLVSVFNDLLMSLLGATQGRVLRSDSDVVGTSKGPYRYLGSFPFDLLKIKFSTVLVKQ